MNERVKELMDQAFEGIQVVDEIEEYHLEKFAELLIRECVDACYDHKDVERFGIYPIRVAMVTKACSENIKKHFGVSE